MENNMKTMRSYSPKGLLFRRQSKVGSWIYWRTGNEISLDYSYIDGATKEEHLEGTIRIHTKNWVYKLL